MNNNLAIDWLRHFEKYSIIKRMRLYRFLVLDVYSLYLTYKFCFYAKKHKIIYFAYFLTLHNLFNY